LNIRRQCRSYGAFLSTAAGYYKYASPTGFPKKLPRVFCHHPEKMGIFQLGVGAQRVRQAPHSNANKPEGIESRPFEKPATGFTRRQASAFVKTPNGNIQAPTSKRPEKFQASSSKGTFNAQSSGQRVRLWGE